ncbi:hypothetical protein B9Z51_15305, partial [Limnohabitans sp. T6-5]|uniref:hypothetical protein n=1 Tax=Limnohabitans sp. T6-5 TaxID=1100724 RepID=UPI000DD212BF
GKNAGSYTSTITGSNANLENNYANITKAGGTLTIGKNTSTNVVLTANSDTKVYNGTTQAVTGFAVTGLLGDDVTNSAAAVAGISAGTSGKNAGSYTSTITGSNANLENNYANITKAGGTLTIGKNTSTNVVLTANSDTKVYNGTTQAVTGFAVTGLLGDDVTNSAAAVAGISAGTSGKNAGSYTVAVTGNNTNLSSNYANVRFVAGSLDIAKVNATVTGTNTTATADGTLKTQAEATKSGFIVGEDVNVSGLASGTTAGTYNSNLSLSPTNAATLLNNYNIKITNAALTINPAAAILSTAVIPVTIPQTRTVTPISRLTLSGFSNQSGVGAAVAGSVDPQEPTNASALSCTPENDMDCACEDLGSSGVELCLAPARS